MASTSCGGAVEGEGANGASSSGSTSSSSGGGTSGSSASPGGGAVACQPFQETVVIANPNAPCRDHEDEDAGGVRDAAVAGDGGATSFCKNEISSQQCFGICYSVWKRQPLQGGMITCALVPNDPTRVECERNVVCGRRFEGLAEMGSSLSSSSTFNAITRHLAACAYLEAASVHAFENLARDLADHHAPNELIAETRRARRDEVRHTKIMDALARKRAGGENVIREAVQPPPSRQTRTLESIAIENAKEGCVREAFGALVAKAQATNAADVSVRRAMARIADDELRHAALAWAIDAWVRTQLDNAACDRIDEARAAALTTLRQDASIDVAPDVVNELGVPSAAFAVALVGMLERALSAAA